MQWRCSGMTMVELMVSVVISVIVVTTIGGVAMHDYRANRRFAGYARDVREARRVLSMVERDVRGAELVRAASDRIELVVAGHTVTWRLRDGSVERAAPAGIRPIASRVARLEFRMAGGGVQCSVWMRARLGRGGPPPLVTYVRPRPEVER